MAEESSGPRLAEESSGQTKTRQCHCKVLLFQLICAIPLVVLSLAFLGDDIRTFWEMTYGYGSVPDYGLPAHIMEQFAQYDGDANGCIDPEEFSIMSTAGLRNAEGFSLDMNDIQDKETYVFEDSESGPGTNVIAIKAELMPLNISTMSKFSNWNDYLVGSPQKLVPGLTSWKEVVREFDFYGTRNFKVFLPSYGRMVVGEPYYIIASQDTIASMNRYHPSQPSKDRALIHAMLSQFHQNIFVISRFGPIGSVGVIRAMTDETVEVIFRIHCEYQLNHLPDYPFWFTPGQFTGRLTIDRNGNQIHYFELHLPTDKHLNVDMEWISGPGANEVDIGYMPKMRLVGSATLPWMMETDISEDMLENNYQPPEVDMTWKFEISEKDALRKLEVLMYPFKKVYYHSLLEAITSAVSSSKFPVEIMVLNVSSDNESVMRKMNANDLLDSTEKNPIQTFERCDATSGLYLDFLKKGSMANTS